ncbi:MAG: DUF177 domain-containing protein [Bacteroidetes bacterium]|nr:DUF177 domain-containing protein [Bacteroidota bacterium]
MDRLNKYSIPFAGLAKGSHQYEFDIDDKFFESFENSVIKKARVHIDLDFNKSETVLTLTFRMVGSLHMNCDRCLEDFDMPVDTTVVMLVKFGEPGVGETDDIIVISHSDSHLNIAQHIYDYLSLQVPMRVVHPDDESGNPTCDPEFIAKLNEIKEESPEDGPVDPRWEALKKLGFNEN